ncbi:hypothetical protein E1301_Tti017196 [Triplophysa tibetana]|uniref:SEA domain-containing protein n=1 Tax=Triplophysa tibetana TaxID=1572043 RepID=A0A5A9PLK8_9TELE|nr:hypothetical protein E1301_Tti017196 [Triplophysa tibetana]
MCLILKIESLYKKRFTNFRRYVIRRFSQGSIVTEGALEFNANNSNPNVSELAKVLVDAVKAGNLTIQIKNDSINVTTPASTVTPLFNTSQINVTFSLTDTFTAALTNLSSPEAIHLTNKITTQFVTVFMRRYANILRMVIRKFSPGSIVTDSALEFKDNDIVPKAQDVVNVIIDAAKAGSFNLSIDKKTVSASDSSGVPVTPLFNTSQINVTFSLTDSFTAALSNLSSPEAKNLTDKITTQFVTVFKRRYANILRMVVRKFSNGSIVTEGTLEFSDLETVPKVQDVVNVIVDAAKAGSFNLSIDARTVNATDSSGNSAEALFNISKIDVKFSIMDTFNDSLTNLSSSEAINRANNITTEFVKVFKRRYANILKMLIKKFRKGSIVTEGTLEFKDNDIVPKAQDVVNFIVKEVKAGSFSFPVDEKSITATDSSGNFVSKLTCFDSIIDDVQAGAIDRNSIE